MGRRQSQMGIRDSYAYTGAETIPALVPGRARTWAVGYCLMAALLAAVQVLARPNEGGR